MNNSTRERQLEWLAYWQEAIKMQYLADQEATVGTPDGSRPVHRDDTDRAINEFIVAFLASGLDGLREQLQGWE